MIHKIQYLRTLPVAGMGATTGWTDKDLSPDPIDPNIPPDPFPPFVDPDIPPEDPRPAPPVTYSGPNFALRTWDTYFDGIINSFYLAFRDNGVNTVECLLSDENSAGITIDASAMKVTKIIPSLTWPSYIEQASGISQINNYLNTSIANAKQKISDIRTTNNKIVNDNRIAAQKIQDEKDLQALKDQEALNAKIEKDRLDVIKNELFKLGETISMLDAQNPLTIGRKLVNGLEYISNKKDVHTRDEAGNIIVTKQ
jgi:hypothetical protein